MEYAATQNGGKDERGGTGKVPLSTETTVGIGSATEGEIGAHRSASLEEKVRLYDYVYGELLPAHGYSCVGAVLAERDQLRADLEAVRCERDEAQRRRGETLRVGLDNLSTMNRIEKERDTLRADLAAERKRVEVLEGALRELVHLDDAANKAMTREVRHDIWREGTALILKVRNLLSTQSESEATQPECPECGYQGDMAPAPEQR